MNSLQLNIKQQMLNSYRNVFDTTFDVIRWLKEILNVNLFPNQIKIINTIVDPTISKINVLGARQGGKCIVGDTEIINFETGELFTAKNLFDSKKEIKTLGIEIEKDYSLTPSNFEIFQNGEKDVFKITTKSGRSIELTPNHPLLTFNEEGYICWKPLETLKVGDFILKPKSLPIFGTTEIENYKVILLAYLISEGCLLHSASFCNTEKILIDEFIKCVEKFENIKVSKRGTSYYACKKSGLRNSLITYLRGLDLYNKNSFDKFIPNIIFTLSKKQIALFLNRLFAGDGSVWFNKESNHNNIQIEYYTVSFKLARQVQHLLFRFGIDSHLYERETYYTKSLGGFKSKKFKSYGVGIGSIKGKLIFVKEIGIIGEKGKKLEKCLVDEENIKIFSMFDGYYPHYIINRSLKLMKDSHLMRDKKFTRAQYSHLHCIKRYNTISGTKGLRIAKIVNNFDLINMYTNLSTEIITDITYVGKKMTYDLSVPRIHNFIANDLIIHNTFSVCAGLCKLNLTYPNYRGIIFAPKEEQSKRLIEETIETILRKSSLYSEINKNKTSSLKLIYKNGSGLLALSGGKTAEQEGWSAGFIVTDECVPYDTKITLADGTERKIGEIVENKEQCLVLSTNNTGNYVPCKINDWFKISLKQDLIEIEYEIQDKIYTLKCTPHHLVYTKNRGYVEARYLTIVDILVAENNSSFINIEIKSIKRIPKDIDYVYDITTENHNYFANRVKVHNSHRISSQVYSGKILPMLGASFLPKIIKIGIAKFKNHFRDSCNSKEFTTLKFKWNEAEIYFRSGETVIDGIRYPTKILDLMPYTIKQVYFPNHPEVWTRGELTELDWKTQYEMEWVEGINLFLDEDGTKKLTAGDHLSLTEGRDYETYVAGLDFAGGSESSGGDYTSLTIIRVGRQIQGRNEKAVVAVFNWQKDLYEQLQDIFAIINPASGKFKCVRIVADYGGLGAPLVDIMKKQKLPVVPIKFGARDPKTGKNFKNAMFDLTWTEIKEGRLTYPKDFETKPSLKKAVMEWENLERHENENSLNAQIQAGDGFHDDDCCFSSNTQIPLLNGTTKTIKELSELSSLEDIWTYSLDENQNIVPGKVLKAWKTGTKETLKITLDNNESFSCTPDHLIMLRDGTYKRADELKEQDSLMPLYKKLKKIGWGYKKEYEIVYVPQKNKYFWTHRIIAIKTCGNIQKRVIHHKDFNKLNNSPDNLDLLNISDHMKLHIQNGSNNFKNFWSKKSPQERSEINFQRSCKLTKEQRRQKALKGWENSNYKERCLINKRTGLKNRKPLIAKTCPYCKKTFFVRNYLIKRQKFCSEWCSWKGRRKRIIKICSYCKKSFEIKPCFKNRKFCSYQCFCKQNHKSLKVNLFIEKYSKDYLIQLYKEKNNWKDVANFLNVNVKFLEVIRLRYLDLNSKRNFLNHKIIKIEKGITEDVYDLTIDKYHNFAIGFNDKSGIFVHNCSLIMGTWACDKVQASSSRESKIKYFPDLMRVEHTTSRFDSSKKEHIGRNSRGFDKELTINDLSILEPDK